MLYLGFRFVERLVWRGALDIVLETVGVFLRNFVSSIVMMLERACGGSIDGVDDSPCCLSPESFWETRLVNE